MERTSPLDYSTPTAKDSRARFLTFVAVVSGFGACLCLLAAAVLFHTALLPPDKGMTIKRTLVLLSPLLGIVAALTACAAARRRTGAWEVTAAIATVSYWAGFAAAAFSGLL